MERCLIGEDGFGFAHGKTTADQVDGNTLSHTERIISARLVPQSFGAFEALLIIMGHPFQQQ